MTTATAVLHLTLANLKPGVAESEAEALLGAYARLEGLPGVLHLGAVRSSVEGSTHGLALFAYLADAASLEAYGMDPRHIDFVRGALLEVVTDLATADVAPSALPPAVYAAAACFGASFRGPVFDWQLRDLQRRLAGGLFVSGGGALNDRQRFRAAGLAFWADGGLPPEAAFGDFRRRCQEFCAELDGEAVLVLGRARRLAGPAPAAEPAV